MSVANGTDQTANVDLTSDLDGSDSGNSYVPNNGAPVAPPGTRVAGTDAASSTAPQGQQASAAAPVDKSPSVRDLLSSAFKGTGGETQGQQGAQTAQPDPQGRVRNADGTFAPTPEQQAAAGAQQGQPQQFQAPQGLPPAVAAQFTQLPAEVQQFVASTMEREAQNAQRYSEFNGLEQVLAPRREALAMQGMDTAQYVNQLTALSDFAGRDPEQFVAWFAGQHGIDLGVLAEGAPPVDPQYEALQNQVVRLNAQLQQFTQGQQQAAQQSIVQEIEQFAAEADQGGQLARPYFAELGTGILPFIQAIKAENPTLPNREVLTQAYDRACWGNPTVRAKMQAASEATRLAGQRETAARAGRAGASVTGAPVSGASAPNNAGDGSVRGILQAQFAAS